MALNEVVKNVYTFANILSQAHQSHIRLWDLQSFHNALKWAKFCMKVEEKTRDKEYGEELNRHIQLLTVLLNPVSLIQLDLKMLQDSVKILCYAISQNEETPPVILSALKNLGTDYFEKNWHNNHEASPSKFGRVYKLLGYYTDFRDESIDVLANHIVERLLDLLKICTYSEQRYDRFLEKVFHRLLAFENGWFRAFQEIIVHMMLKFTDFSMLSEAAERLLRKMLALLSSLLAAESCGLWKCDPELICTLCGYDDDLLDLYINHIWTWADGMEPEYGLCENGDLYKWRYSHRFKTDLQHYTFEQLVNTFLILLTRLTRHKFRLKNELIRRSEASYFNIYRDILQRLCDRHFSEL